MHYFKFDERVLDLNQRLIDIDSEFNSASKEKHKKRLLQEKEYINWLIVYKDEDFQSSCKKVRERMLENCDELYMILRSS